METLLLSRQSWSVHLVRGRAGGRFHVGSGGRPTDSSTWRSMAWCAGMLSGNLATCPNMALRPLVIQSDTDYQTIDHLNTGFSFVELKTPDHLVYRTTCSGRSRTSLLS